MSISKKKRAFLWVLLLAGSGCQTLPVGGASFKNVKVAPPPAVGPTKILVGYYSLRKNTEKLAEAVVEGANRIPDVTVVKKPVAEITKSDLESAQGIILGCPTYFANIPGEMKSIMDHWAWKERADLTDKVGGAFSTGGNFTGGKEHTVISLLLYMINNRMVVVGPIHREGPGGFGEIGASAVTGEDDPGLREAELNCARKLGERVSRVARNLTGMLTPPRHEE